MATPHVAGAFAALMSAGASGTEAELYLFSTAADLGASGTDSLYGNGEIRVNDALNAYLAAATGSDLDALTAGDLIISEIMPNPAAVSDWKGEWFEIYNNTASDININGLEIASAGQMGFTVSSDLTIASGEYAVFAVRGSAGENGGISSVDYVYNYNNAKLYDSDSLSMFRK